MIHLHFQFLMTLLFALLKSGPSFAQMVPLEIELEALPEARSYQIEITDPLAKPQRPQKLNSKNGLFKAKINLGIYQARSRAADRRGVFGQWSELFEIRAGPEAPKIKNKPEAVDQMTKTETGYELKFLWNATPCSNQYRVDFYTNQKPVKSMLLETTELRLELPPGQYQYRISGISKSGIESSQSSPLTNLSLEKLGNLDTPVLERVNLKWRLKIPAGVLAQGTLSFRFHLDNEWKVLEQKADQLVRMEEREWRPGHYRIEMTLTKAGWNASKPWIHEWDQKPTASEIGHLEIQ